MALGVWREHASCEGGSVKQNLFTAILSKFSLKSAFLIFLLQVALGMIFAKFCPCCNGSGYAKVP